jgi:hypothetical protein
MSILSWLLRRPKRAEAIESPLQALQSDTQALQSPTSTESVDELLKELKSWRESKPIPIQSSSSTLQIAPQITKESFQLGLASGYTGRSIRNIEDSLNRIELNMASKDWFKTEFEDTTPKLMEMIQAIRSLLQEHDLNEMRRFQVIQESLEKMSNAAKEAPEPVKQQIFHEIESIRQQIPLSPKMKELISVVKQAGQLSYEDLAVKLGITVSGLRGLLATTLVRTAEIERFSVSGKGWVRYKEASSA